MVANPVITLFLKELFGGEVICMSYAFVRSAPDHPGVSLNTDGQTDGFEIFGYDGSCPWTVHVLFYLEDLTPRGLSVSSDSPVSFCMHANANPCKRYEAHPEEVMIPAIAGSAILINHKEVLPWSPELLASLPTEVRPFFGDRNNYEWDFHGGNKPLNMVREAPGMNPSRWKRI